MFESLGLTVTDERPYKVKPRDGAPVWIYDFGLQCAGTVDVDAIRERFHEGFAARVATARPSRTASTA